MNQTSRYGACLLIIFLQLGFIFQTVSQVQTARNISTSPNSGGFYEFLPQGYTPGGTKFPLIVFIHGNGELGNGVSELSRILLNGPPNIAASGGYGTDFKFIIISPQFKGWPSVTDTDAIIEYAMNNYEVDRTRVYLTGLSMGGGATWDYAGDNAVYAKKLAAIFPVCGASYPWVLRAEVIAKANLPVWATHNQGDDIVPVSQTETYVSLINSQLPPPVPLAKKTIFPVNGHNAWATSYSLTFTENGLNAYQWMMQYQSASAALPIVLGNYKAFLNGSSTVTIQWNTISETNNKNFVVEKSLDGSNFSLFENIAAANDPSGHDYSITDNKPSSGNNFYRLSQVDNDGKTTYFNVLKVIVPVSDNQRYFHLSPNPVVSSLMLELVNPSTGVIQVSLTDMQGRPLKKWKFQKTSLSWQQSIDISGIPKGNYIIQLNGNNIHEVQRFVKQ
jgi:Secretion system C-terminal sorting domain